MSHDQNQLTPPLECLWILGWIAFVAETVNPALLCSYDSLSTNMQKMWCKIHRGRLLSSVWSMACIFKSTCCYCNNHFFKRNISNNYSLHDLNAFWFWVGLVLRQQLILFLYGSQELGKVITSDSKIQK